MAASIRVLIRQKADREHLLLYFVDPHTGREKSKSAGTADKGEAERAAARWEAELVNYRGADNAAWDWFKKRFKDEHLITLSQSSRASYGTALNHYQRLMKPASVVDIDESSLSIFVAALDKEDRPATSIRNYLTHLRSALNWALHVKMVSRVPKFRMPKTVKRKLMRGRPLNEVEYKRLLETCKKSRPDDYKAWQRFIELMWLSGLRVGEACRLSWDCPPLLVAIDAKPYPHMVLFGEGHKNAEDTTIPIPPDFAAWLRKTPPKKRTGKVAPILGLSSDRQLIPKKVMKTIARIGRESGIVVDDQTGKRASAHDVRRGFGRRWAAVVRPLTLQAMMRHKNIETTLRYYVGLSAEDANAELWGSVPKNVPKGA